MALAAILEQTDKAGTRRRAPRRTLKLAAQGTIASGAQADVVVHNISATGMLIECTDAVEIGDELAIDLPEAKATRLKVVWSSGKLKGCEFARPLAKSVLSAASLRSVVGAGATATSAAQAEPFGMRLRRLRETQGLSLAKVADMVGVSKPTVWAWEQGRARPAGKRLDALAKAVGVTKAQLVSGRNATVLDDVLVRARHQVAEAYGIESGQVRIMIEL